MYKRQDERSDSWGFSPQSGNIVLTAFLVALQFLTITPPLMKRLCTPQELGRAVGFFPLVGLMLGSVLYGLDELLQLLWPIALSAALILTAWVVSTGALHLDGFLDTCDGMFGGRTPDERLRIMKDERVGAYAVIGGTLLLLVKYLALLSAHDRLGAMLLAPTLGRWSMVLALVLFPYARPEGLGSAMKEHAGLRQIICATLITVPACWFAGQERGLIALMVTGAATWLTARLALRRLPGLTGDIYGAICALIEVLVLLVFAARVYT